MAISIITNFTANTPEPLDSRMGPYASVNEATGSINALFRYVGQTVIITGSGVPVEYWFYPTTANNNLVLKGIGSETDPIFVARSASLATTGSNVFVGNQIISGSLNVSGSFKLLVNAANPVNPPADNGLFYFTNTDLYVSLD